MPKLFPELLMNDCVSLLGPPVRPPGPLVKQVVQASADLQSRAREEEEEMDSSHLKNSEAEEQTARMKKTPTQQRRDRKKRQKEREKRQREQEKLGSEESDGQAISPTPSLVTTTKETGGQGSLTRCSKCSVIPSLAILATKVALEF